MLFQKSILTYVVSLLLSISVFAQSSAVQKPAKTDEEKELEKKALLLIDEVIKDAQSLKLPENRIRIQADVADLLWAHDEKRARALFKEAVDGLIEVMSATENNDPVYNDPTYAVLSIGRAQLRHELLQVAARHDPKLARDFMQATRQQVNRAAPFDMGQHLDVQLEMNLASRLAAKDPKQALQIAEESLERGFSYLQPEALIGLLVELQAKDRESAVGLTASIMKRLRSENLATNEQALNFAFSLLRAPTYPMYGSMYGYEVKQKKDLAKESSPIMDEQTLRELANMVASAALARLSSNDASERRRHGDDESLYFGIQSILPQVEKYAPSRAAALRAKLAQISKTLDPETKARSELMALGEDASVEAYLEAAARAPAEMREEFYEMAIDKAVEQGDFDRARRIANEHIPDPADRKEILAEIDEEALDGTPGKERPEEVRQLISQAKSNEARAMMLTERASAAAGSGDKKTALQLLVEARGLVGGEAQNHMQFNAQIAIANVYASIEPVQGFEMIEPMVERINALVAAAAVLSGFDHQQHFKDGEMLLQGPGVVNNVVSTWSNCLRLLARSDLGRTKAAADSLQRNEVRILARLSVIRGVLSNDPAAPTFSPAGFTRFTQG